MAKVIATEEQEQISLFNRAQYYSIICNHLIAIPNGGLRNKVIAKKLKLAGVKAGVSDIFFALPCCGYAGLWIELKRKNTTDCAISDLQKEWLRRMIAAGYMAKVAKGADEAWQIINDYLDGKCSYDEWYNKSKTNEQIITDSQKYR